MSVGRPKSWLKEMALMLLISALVHMLLLLIAPYLLPKVDQSREKSLRAWLKPEKPLEAKEKKPAYQVVNLVPAKKSPPPDDAKYRAEFDQRVDVEKKSTAKAVKKESKPAQAPKKPKLLAQGRGQRRLLDPLGIRPTFLESSAKESDYLPDVAEGDSAKLNAWQWQHAPFFNRMKESIGSAWAPQEQIERYDPSGELLGQIGRVTILSISIDKKGEITKIFVKEPSGVAYLDEEATRAVRKASPFVYPPPELFDGGNEFSFTFAFHLEINRGVSLNFDWDK